MVQKFARLGFEVYAIFLGVALFFPPHFSEIAVATISRAQLMIMAISIGLAIMTRFDKKRIDSYESMVFYLWGVGILISLFLPIGAFVFWPPIFIGWAFIGADLKKS